MKYIILILTLSTLISCKKNIPGYEPVDVPDLTQYVNAPGVQLWYEIESEVVPSPYSLWVQSQIYTQERVSPTLTKIHCAGSYQYISRDNDTNLLQINWRSGPWQGQIWLFHAERGPDYTRLNDLNYGRVFYLRNGDLN